MVMGVLLKEVTFEERHLVKLCVPNISQRTRKDINIGNRTNADDVVTAYEKLLHWQADYIAANGCPYNFIHNKSYFDDMGITAAPENSTEKVADEEIKELREEIEKELTADGKKAIMEDLQTETTETKSFNPLLIAIPVILVACGAGFYFGKKKNKN